MTKLEKFIEEFKYKVLVILAASVMLLITALVVYSTTGIEMFLLINSGVVIFFVGFAAFFVWIISITVNNVRAFLESRTVRL